MSNMITGEPGVESGFIPVAAHAKELMKAGVRWNKDGQRSGWSEKREYTKGYWDASSARHSQRLTES